MAVLSWPDPLPAYGRVALRPFLPVDLPLVEELSRDLYVPLIGTIPVPYSREAGLAYLDRQHQRRIDGTGWSFAVVDRETDRAIGTAGLWLHPDRPASAGYTVAPSARGRGVAGAALTALTAFGWTVPGVDRIELFIEPWNTGSLRVAERCGYLQEVLLPGHFVIGGQPRDVVRYAVTC